LKYSQVNVIVVKGDIDGMGTLNTGQKQGSDYFLIRSIAFMLQILESHRCAFSKIIM
jgi:hypothetical protein